MRDKTHRVATTIVLVLSFTVATLVYFAMVKRITLPQAEEISALIAFSIGMFMNTSYLLFNFRSLKHKDTKLNTSTQIWFGIVVIIASLVALLLIGFGMEFSTALILMSGIVITLLYLSIERFDEFLEKSVAKSK